MPEMTNNIITLPAHPRIILCDEVFNNGKFIGWLAQDYNHRDYELAETKEEAIGALLLKKATVVYVY